MYITTWCTSNCPASCTRHVRETKESVEQLTNADMVKRAYARWMEKFETTSSRDCTKDASSKLGSIEILVR